MSAKREPLRPAVVGIIGLAVCALVVMLALNAGRLPFVGNGGREISAEFTDASGLETGDRVEVAGVRVGSVTGLEMGRGFIRISFTVPGDLELGEATRASIKVGNLLGSTFVQVTPAGGGSLDGTIPVARTASAYDVSTALGDLTATVEPIDTAQLEQALASITKTFTGAGPDVRASVRGLSTLSRTIAARDQAVASLLSRSNTLAGSLDGSRADIAGLVRDAGSLLAALDARRTALHGLIVHTRELAAQLRGLVDDNERQIGPALESLGAVAAQLQTRQADLEATVHAVAKFARVFVDTIGGGPWFDSYIGNAPDSLKIEAP